MNQIDSEFREQEEISGVISVGSGGLKAASVLPELIEHFRERYPLAATNFVYYNKLEKKGGTKGKGKKNVKK